MMIKSIALALLLISLASASDIFNGNCGGSIPSNFATCGSGSLVGYNSTTVDSKAFSSRIPCSVDKVPVACKNGNNYFAIAEISCTTSYPVYLAISWRDNNGVIDIYEIDDLCDDDGDDDIDIRGPRATTSGAMPTRMYNDDDGFDDNDDNDRR